MASRLLDGYLGVFKQYPFLVPLAVVAGAGQAAFALVNIYALPLYLVNDLHVSGLALGAASATFLCSETILKFPLGRLSDRLGRKLFIMLGPLVVCLNPVIFIALPARLWFLIFPLRVADGAGAAALWPPLFAAVGDRVKDRTRAAAMSVINTVYVAAVGGAVVIGAFAAHLTGSNRSSFILASVLLIVTAVTAYLWLPQSKVTEKQERSIAIDPPAEQASERRRLAPAHRSRLFESLAARLLVPVLLISFLMSAGVLLLSNFLVLYLQLDMALTPLRMVALLLGLAVVVLAFGLPLGHMADRWGTRNAVRLSLALSALTMWLIPSCRGIGTLAPVAALLVVSHILGTPAWLAVVSQLAPAARRGGVMALVATGEGIGAVVGPLVGGLLWDIHHPWIFYGSAALLSAAAALAFAILPKLPVVSDEGDQT